MIIFGFYRGFIKEILGLFSLSFSLFLSVVCNKWIVENVFHSVENSFVISIVVYCITFMFFIIIFSIIVKCILRLLVDQSDSLMDRFFGGVIGFVKAYLFCFFIYFVIFSFTVVLKPDLNENNKIEDIKDVSPEWLRDSKTFPIFYNSIIRLDHLIKKFDLSNRDLGKIDDVKINKGKKDNHISEKGDADKLDSFQDDKEKN
jgi:membrane protein required for colicin V production